MKPLNPAHWCRGPAFVICKLSYFPTTSGSVCSLVDMPVQKRMLIFTYLQVLRKSRHTDLMFTGADLLVHCLVPMFRGTQQYLFDPHKQTFTRSHATHLAFCQSCQRLSAATWNKGFVTQVTVAAKSVETATSILYSKCIPAHLPSRCGEIVERRTRWLGSTERTSQVFQLTNGGCVVTMSRVFFFGNKSQSQMKTQDKINGWKAKWASRDVLMLLLTSEIKGRMHFSSKQSCK